MGGTKGAKTRGGGMGKQEELRYILYKNKFPMKNVIVMCGKRVLIKNKI